MSKFGAFKSKGKGLMKNVVSEGVPIIMTTAGVVVAQKFLDFKTLLPNAKPDAFYMKHEGLVKLGGAIIALAMFKKLPMPVRFLIAGIGVQGGIKAVRQYTMNDAGKAFMDQIGENNNYSDEINEAAAKILSFAANTSNTSVSGPNTSNVLKANSNTGVSGMGMNDDDDLAA